MPLKLKKYDGITALDNTHPLFSKVDSFVVFDTTIKDLKSGQVYTSTSSVITANDPLGANVRQFDASGDILSPALSIPFPSTVLMVYRQYGNNPLGGGNTRMIHLFSGDMFVLDAGNWSGYDYEYVRRGGFGSVFYTYFKPYRVGLDWGTQQAEITAKRQQAHCTAIDYVSGATSFWQDGVQHLPVSGDTAPIFTPSTNPVQVQISQAVGVGKEWNVAAIVVFNSVLTDAEKEAITQEPWGLTNGAEAVEASISNTLTPNSTITATLLNYVSLPTTTTITDSRGNTLVLPLTQTSATTVTFTVPALSGSSVGLDYLLFGDVTLTFGAKSITSTFEPVFPLTRVTLVAPVATNAFQGWGSDVPVAGEQLISQGNFDQNGNFTGADPDATYTCWITRLNGDNHKFSISMGQASSQFSGDVILKTLTVSPSPLQLIVGNGFVGNIGVRNLTVNYPQLSLTTGTGFSGSIIPNNLTVTPQNLYFVSFRNIPIDTSRIFYIK